MSLTFVRQVIGFALSTTLGVLVTQSLVNSRAYRASRLLTGFVGCGLGFGLTSLIWFVLWCGVAPGSTLVPVAAEFFAVILLLRFGDVWSPPLSSHRERKAFDTPKMVVALGMLSSAAALFFFVRFLMRAPYAGGDAWSIWNLHARAFFLGGGRIWRTELYKIGWSHPDYPLLVPLSVARLWFFTGSESATAPAIVAFLYTFGTAGVLAGALSQLKSRSSGTLALAILLASTRFLLLGLEEYADVPESFYLLTALAMLAFYELSGELRFLILTGLSAGFAAWTKNEGWMFLGCLVASRLILSRLSISWRISSSAACAFLGGALPVVVIAVIYKWMNPAHSYVLNWFLTKRGWTQVLDAKRLLYIAGRFGQIVWPLELWFMNSIVIVVIYTTLVGFEKDAAVRKASATGLLTICLMLVGYFCVYSTSTINLSWYMDTSLERLYLQLWPSFLLCVFLLTRDPFSRPGPEKRTDAGFLDRSTLERPTRHESQ